VAITKSVVITVIVIVVIVVVVIVADIDIVQTSCMHHLSISTILHLLPHTYTEGA